jgi:hypothetical protein
MHIYIHITISTYSLTHSKATPADPAPTDEGEQHQEAREIPSPRVESPPPSPT